MGAVYSGLTFLGAWDEPGAEPAVAGGKEFAL